MRSSGDLGSRLGHAGCIEWLINEGCRVITIFEDCDLCSWTAILVLYMVCVQRELLQIV